MPYIIDVASMDFPDGAQRFNWCNCQKPAALAAGLQGLGIDWTVTDQDLAPLVYAGSAPASAGTLTNYVSSLSGMLPSWWPLAAIALGLYWFVWRKRKGRR